MQQLCSCVQLSSTCHKDIFKTCAEHVAFNEIVVPGVVYVEHAMEVLCASCSVLHSFQQPVADVMIPSWQAVKTIVGKEGYLKDLVPSSAAAHPLVSTPAGATDCWAGHVNLATCPCLSDLGDDMASGCSQECR